MTDSHATHESNQDNVSQWVQVETAEHYAPLTYLTPWRMAAIGYQIRFLGSAFPNQHVMEIGPGNGLTTRLLREMGHRVTTLDVDKRLQPDIAAPITEIPRPDRDFDCFICCQVLEHIPWELVDDALCELRRVVRHGGVISVPTNQPTWMVMKYDAKSWGTRRITLGSRRNKPIRNKDGEHHWELEANVTRRDFEQKLLAAGFSIKSRVQPAECMYHQFFVLEAASK